MTVNVPGALDEIATAQIHLDNATALLSDEEPPVPPDVQGVELVLTEITYPPELVQGVAGVLGATVRNAGDTDVEPGVIVGVGFFVEGVQASWWSSQAGLAAGEELTLDTATAPMTGGAWTPRDAGELTLTGFVDDLDRIPEWDETNNEKSVRITVAEGSAPPPGHAALFPASSLWNTVKHVTNFAGGADDRLRALNYGINNGPYSHPMTWSSANDPVHHIACPNTWGWPAQTLTVNMRDDATPAGGTDGHLCLLNGADGRLVDMWQLRPTGNRQWACSAYAMHNWQSGTGWGSTSPWQSAGVTAAGAPTAAGTITADEVNAGEIPHALCMAFDYGDQGGVNTSWAPGIPPAINNDVGGGPGPICEGALLIATGTEPAGLNAAEHALWVAASTYGCWVVDKLDGIPMFFGDRSSAVGNAFRGDKLTAIGRQLRMAVTW